MLRSMKLTIGDAVSKNEHEIVVDVLISFYDML
jgi:hypothetical protein